MQHSSTFHNSWQRTMLLHQYQHVAEQVPAMPLLAFPAGMPGPVWLPTLVGAAIGGLFAAAHRYCSARVWRPPNSPLNILVTGM
jgi:hypothetical protein